MSLTDIVRHVVSRSKIDDLPLILKDWGCLGEDVKSLDVKHKNNLTQQISTLCEAKSTVSKDRIGELDLVCTKTYPSKRIWTVHHLQNKTAGSSRNLTKPQKLKEKIKNQIMTFFDEETSVCLRLDKGALWGRIYIDKTKDYTPSNVVYFVHQPKTPFIIISRYKVSFETFLLQSLKTAFGYNSLIKMQLSGRHVESLLQLALNKPSQGAFSKFRVGQVQNIPLVSKATRKRKEPEYEEISGICCEDESSKQRRREKLEDTFGPTEQPFLEKIEYKVSVKFRGTDFAPDMADMEEPFHCRVKFEGSAVLEGIRNMASCGLATLPLPHHLSSVSSLAKNYFILEDKTKHNRSKSQMSQSNELENN